MGIRPLLASVLALAMLFATAVTGSTMAAAATIHNDMQMSGMGHCSSQPVKSDDGKAPAKACCVAMCMALAIAPAVPLRLPDPQHQISYSPVPRSWHGYLGEIATPPPRRA